MTLKLTDPRVEYKTVAQVAAELQQEINQAGLGPSPGKEESDLALALELARLQTEVADLREHTAELEEKLHRAGARIDELMRHNNEATAYCAAQRRWAKLWKKAAKTNRQAVNDYIKLVGGAGQRIEQLESERQTTDDLIDDFEEANL